MRCIFLLAFSFPLFSFSQNLLVNGSFEDENICTEYSKNCAPEGWMISTLQSSFYFNDSANSYNETHFIGLADGTNGRYSSRNFITSQLLCGSRAGSSYALQFFIREDNEKLDSVGVFFSSDNTLYRKWGIKDAVPDFMIEGKYVSAGKLPWMKVNTVYKARGDESFITIAFFGKKPPVQYRSGQFAFYIDSISLTPLNPNEKLCSNAEEVKQALYDENERHQLLDRIIYERQHKPAEAVVLPKTKLIRIDTLIIPDVLFATDSYKLNANANKVLDSFILSSKQVSIDSVIVEGHTDSTGSVAHNQKLSQDRAASVVNYLQPHFQNIISRSWASEKPVADNRTAAGRQKNRRVEVYLYVRE